MKHILLALILTFAFSTTAHAYWDVQNSGEDVFGNVNVTASSVGDNGNLIRFECGSSSEPFFVFLVRDSSGLIPELPAEFLHIDQNGARHQSEATLGPWNENYLAVKVTDEKMLRGIVDHMVVATKSLSVGFSVSNIDLRIADTFSSRGSTAAGRTLQAHCISD
jgi:hypothetical protein